MRRLAISLCFGFTLLVSGEVSSQAQTATVLYSFTGQTTNGTAKDGDAPNSLIEAQDGNYYGTTAFGGNAGNCTDLNGRSVGCGTVFRMAANDSSATVTVLYNFSGGADGGYPTGLIQGPDGNLYGTTAFGGASITANTACTDNNGGNNGAVDPNKGKAEPCCVDASGTNNIGCGTLFKISPSQPPLAGQSPTVVSFDGPTKGAYPSSLTAGFASDGETPLFYGISQACSYCLSNGSLFSFDPVASTFSPLAFGASNLSFPNSLIQGECSNGVNCDLNLYGTAQLGGTNCSTSNSFGCGGVFKYSVSTQKDSLLCTFGDSVNPTPSAVSVSHFTPNQLSLKPETVIRQSGVRFPFDLEWSFNSIPIALTESSDGSILGTTPWACFSNNGGYLVGAGCGTGANDVATVFQCQPPPSDSTSWTLNTIYPFTGESAQGGNVSGTTDGGGSLAGINLASDGNYYGSSGNGIFEIPTGSMNDFLTSSSSNPPTELANLNPFALLPSADSSNGMIQGNNGNFYGTSSTGGQNSDGVLYEIAPSSSISSPVLLTITPSQIVLGQPATLKWSVPNAFSLTAQQCYAFVQGSGATGAGSWSGLQSGNISNGAYDGSLSITPTATGNYTYVLSCAGTISGTVTLQVNPQLAFTTTTLSNGVVNQAYSASVASQASGGDTPYTYSYTGSLPGGLSLNTSAGAITGTPTAVGQFNFSVTVKDAETPAVAVTASFSITVISQTPQVTLTVQPNTGVTYGQAVTLTASESPVEGIAQGYSWAVSEDGSALVTGALSTGSGSYTMATSPHAGQHTFSATFSSTQNYYQPGSSNTVSLAVAKATPSVTAWPTASAITVGQTLASSTLSGGAVSVPGMFTWTTPSTAPAIGTNSESVTFTPTDTADYNTVTGMVTVTVNVGPGFSLLPSPMSVSVAQGGSGTSTITVTNIGGFSGNVTLATTGLPSGVTSSFAAGSAAGTQVLTLTASPSAQVTSTPVAVTVTGTSGTLSATTSVSLTITPQPSFTAGAGGTTSMSIAPGTTTGNTGIISIAGTNGFSGTVNLSCKVTTSLTNVSDMPSCSLNPASVTISGATAQTSTLTVTTTAASSAENDIKKIIWPTGGTTLALVVLLMIPRRRRSWLAISGMLLLCAAIGAVGCSGGSGGGGGGGGGNPGTTAGTYTITVSGASGSVSATVGTVTVTVQ
jgi:hypothetical protein